MNTRVLAWVVAFASLTACSSSFWYEQFQGAQYDKCEKLASPEDRRRCKIETSPDKDKYDKEREAVKGASKYLSLCQQELTCCLTLRSTPTCYGRLRQPPHAGELKR